MLPTADQIVTEYTLPLTLVLMLVGAWMYTLDHKDDWIEDLRLTWYPRLNPYTRKYLDRPLISEVGTDSHVCRTSESPEAVEQHLVTAGAHRNPLATKKYRVLPDGSKQWAASSWVIRPNGLLGDDQFHIFLFPAGDGTDHLGHWEASNVTEPAEHEGGDDLQPGDRTGRYAGLLTAAGANVTPAPVGMTRS